MKYIAVSKQEELDIPPPRETIQDVTKEVYNVKDLTLLAIVLERKNIHSTIMVRLFQFLSWLAPVVTATVLGLVLAVVFPVIGCCILCCRNMGYCGAKSRFYRKKHQNTKCSIYTSVFIVTVILIV